MFSPARTFGPKQNRQTKKKKHPLVCRNKMDAGHIFGRDAKQQLLRLLRQWQDSGRETLPKWKSPILKQNGEQ